MFLGSSWYTIISSILKIAAVLPIKPIFEVFSRRCGISEITDVGIAMVSFFFSMGDSAFLRRVFYGYAFSLKVGIWI